MPVSPEFAEFIKDVFERTATAYTDRPRDEQAGWWQNFYVPRQKEASLFKTVLLKPGTSLIFLLGHVGTGKSTFVLEKMERPEEERLCNGVRIDLSAEGDDLDAIYRTEITRTLGVEGIDSRLRDLAIKEKVFACMNRKIAAAIHQALFFHFLLLQSGALKNPEDFLCTDLFHRVYVPFGQVPIHGSHKAEIEAGLGLAATMALHRFDPRRSKVISAALDREGESTLPDDPQRALELVVALLRENREISEDYQALPDQISPTELATDWLNVYARHFHTEPCIVFIDNVDQLQNAELHSMILEYSRSLAGKLQRQDRRRGIISTFGRIASSAPMAARKVNLVVAIREENFRGGATGSRSSVTWETIVLGEAPESVKGGSKIWIPLDEALLDEIVRSRFETAKREADPSWCSELSDFEATFWRLWPPEKLKRENNRLRELSNHSIRIALQMACALTLATIESLQEERTTLEEHLSVDYDLTIRGRINNWLFSSDPMGTALTEFARIERTKIEDPDQPRHLCCAHRMILTLLYNYNDDEIAFEGRLPVEMVINHIEKTALIPADHLRKTLFELFQPTEGITVPAQREFCDIRSNSVIYGPGDISDDDTVGLTPRGKVLVTEMMPRLEYWHRLTKEKGTRKTLFEHHPLDGWDYVEPIRDIFIKLALAHWTHWKLIVGTRYSGLGDEALPFERYSGRDKLTIGEGFYLERVARSHYSSINHYLVEIMGRDRTQISLSGESRAAFEKDFQPLYGGDRQSRDELPWEDLRKDVRAFIGGKIDGEENKGAVKKLLGWAEELQFAQRAYSSLKSITVAEIRASTPELWEDRLRRKIGLPTLGRIK